MNRDLFRITIVLLVAFAFTILINMYFCFYSGVEIKYRGKRYRIWKQKAEERYRPVGQENNKSAEEITVKDFKRGRLKRYR